MHRLTTLTGVMASLDPRAAFAGVSGTATAVLGLTLGQWAHVTSILAQIVGVGVSVAAVWIAWRRYQLDKSDRKK